MNLPVVIAIRPEPGCAATVAAGRTAGLVVEGWPLFAIHPLAWHAPDPASIDGVLLGSANAIRHGGESLRAFAGKPAYAVGSATADAARAAGFPVAMRGEGGLQGVLDALGGRKLRLLRIAGAEHVPLTPPDGVELVTRLAYASAALPVAPELAARLAGGALVLLHSAAAARHLADEADRIGLPRGAIALAALGPRIADAAGGGWRALRCATRPAEDALLALAREMCDETPLGRGATG